MDIQKTNLPAETIKQVVTYQPPALHQQLQRTILAMEQANQTPEQRQANKLALAKITAELMPAGKPNYLDMIKYPKISDLIAQQGEPVVLLVISIMVRDFCAGMNVARNMNEEQILEAAVMLLNECGTFRLEDYTVMFAMAKRGQLVKVYERIDLAVITAIADEYYARRRDAKYDMEQNDLERQEAQLVVPKKWDNPEQRAKNGNIDDKFISIGGAIGDLKQGLKKMTGNA